MLFTGGEWSSNWGGAMLEEFVMIKLEVLLVTMISS